MSGIILNDDYINWFKDSKLLEVNPASAQPIPLLDSDVVEGLAKYLALHFLDDSAKKDDEIGNASTVCYADSNEVSDDFKIELLPLSFSADDIFHYIYAILFSSKNINGKEKLQSAEQIVLPYPKNQIFFWELVKSGCELRQSNTDGEPPTTAR